MFTNFCPSLSANFLKLGKKYLSLVFLEYIFEEKKKIFWNLLTISTDKLNSTSPKWITSKRIFFQSAFAVTATTTATRSRSSSQPRSSPPPLETASSAEEDKQEVKSDNLQYNTLTRWIAGTNFSLTKRLMFYSKCPALFCQQRYLIVGK